MLPFGRSLIRFLSLTLIGLGGVAVPRLQGAAAIQETPTGTRIEAISIPATSTPDAASLAVGLRGETVLVWRERSRDGTQELRGARFIAESGRWSPAIRGGLESGLGAPDDFIAVANGSGHGVWTMWHGPDTPLNEVVSAFVTSPIVENRREAEFHIGTVTNFDRRSLGWGAAPLNASTDYLVVSNHTQFFGVASVNGAGEEFPSRYEGAFAWSEPVVGNPAIRVFPDYAALIAMPSATPGRVLFARHDGRPWQQTRPLSVDAGIPRPSAGPVTPAFVKLSASGPRVSLIWSVENGSGRDLMLSNSSDAGITFSAPIRVTERLAAPNPRSLSSMQSADIVLLADGTQLVTWLEMAPSGATANAGSLRLQAIPFSNILGAPSTRLLPASNEAGAIRTVAIAPAGTAADGGRRAVLVLERTFVESHLVTLPVPKPGDPDDCGCNPPELPGYPFRGQVVVAGAEPNTVRLRHAAVPGLFRPGETVFRVQAELISSLTVGRQVLGRIEQRGNEWWLFEVRVLAAPAMP